MRFKDNRMARIDAVKLDRTKLIAGMVRLEMTRPEVAKAAGISYGTFTNALIGKAIAMKSARALGKMLGVGVAALMAQDAAAGTAA